MSNHLDSLGIECAHRARPFVSANGARAESLADLRRVVRCHAEADDEDAMLREVRRWLHRTGDPTRGTALATLVLGPDAPAGVRRRFALAFPDPLPSWRDTWRSGVLMIVIVGILLPLAARRPVRFALVHRPTDTEAGPPIQPPVLEVRTLLGEVSRTLDGRAVSATLLSGADSISGGEGTAIVDGRLSLASLRVWTTSESPHRGRPLRLRLKVRGMPDADVEWWDRMGVAP